jgi:hypothetical protein
MTRLCELVSEQLRSGCGALPQTDARQIVRRGIYRFCAQSKPEDSFRVRSDRSNENSRRGRSKTQNDKCGLRTPLLPTPRVGAVILESGTDATTTDNGESRGAVYENGATTTEMSFSTCTDQYLAPLMAQVLEP